MMQVRYSDTPEQKKLKHETAKRREFRTQEYNLAAFSRPYNPNSNLFAFASTGNVRPDQVSPPRTAIFTG
jgi:hypothetical protein